MRLAASPDFRPKLLRHITCDIIDMIRMVLDTSVPVASIRSPGGASRQLLLYGLERRFTFLACVALVLEYQAVMTRPEHLTASRLSVEDFNELLDAVVEACEAVRLAFTWRPVLRNANDDMVLETALNGGANAIVTFNTRDFLSVSDRFGIAVLSPGEALKKVRLL